MTRDGVPLLDSVTLTLPGGTTTALVGPSGAGKSLLAAVASRLTDPDEGTVLLDGTDLRTLSADALRRAVAYAFERPALFGTTIADAVACGPLPEPDLRRALRRAAADTFTNRLPHGTRTPSPQPPLRRRTPTPRPGKGVHPPHPPPDPGRRHLQPRHRHRPPRHPRPHRHPRHPPHRHPPPHHRRPVRPGHLARRGPGTGDGAALRPVAGPGLPCGLRGGGGGWGWGRRWRRRRGRQRHRGRRVTRLRDTDGAPSPLLRPGLTFARRRKGPLGALAAWSLLESARTFLTGYAVARALDDGFLSGDVRTGLLWLLALAAAALAGGLADAGVFRALGGVIEPLRDSLVRRVVRATLTRAVTSPTPADTARVSRLTAQTEIARDAAGGVLLTVRSFLFTSAGAITGLAALSPRLLPLVLIPLAAASRCSPPPSAPWPPANATSSTPTNTSPPSPARRTARPATSRPPAPPLWSPPRQLPSSPPRPPPPPPWPAGQPSASPPSASPPTSPWPPSSWPPPPSSRPASPPANSSPPSPTSPPPSSRPSTPC
ncbi:ATP-binding cassette domain-containing protein [Actinomadura keratinilytica]